MPGRESKGSRILVVDDEPLIREAIKQTLASEGHNIEMAKNGKEALALFEVDKFDLVMMDYEMPDMRGDELALLIKALAPKQSIAILTGHQDTVVSRLLTGVELIMSKPFNADELRRATSTLLAHQ